MTNAQLIILTELVDFNDDRWWEDEEPMFPVYPHIESLWAEKHSRDNIPILVSVGCIEIVNDEYHITEYGRQSLVRSLRPDSEQ